MDRRLSAALAFLAFAVVVVCGLAVGNPFGLIVRRAILALFMFYFLGLAIAWLSERVLSEREEQLDAELREQVTAAAEEEAARSAAGSQMEATANPVAVAKGGQPSSASPTEET